MSKSSKRVIGIPAWAFNDGSMFGVRKEYVQYASEFGDVRILSIYEAPCPNQIDLLLLPGGPDVNPARYGQIPSLLCQPSNIFMEAFDLYHLPHYVEAGTSVFGICRGMQTLNVHFGGTLYQEIGSHPTSTKRETEAAHPLLFHTRYQALTKDKRYACGKVTSRHHQGLDVVADDLDVVAVFDDIPEIVFHKTLNIAGVQYHPESNVEETENLSGFIIDRLLDKTFQEWRRTISKTQELIVAK